MLLPLLPLRRRLIRHAADIAAITLIFYALPLFDY